METFFVYLKKIQISTVFYKSPTYSDDLHYDDLFINQERNHNEIIDRSGFSEKHLVNARMSSIDSILHVDKQTVASPSDDIIPANEAQENMKKKTYKVMLKIIAGSLVGDLNYDLLYDDEEEEISHKKDKGNKKKPFPH